MHRLSAIVAARTAARRALSSLPPPAPPPPTPAPSVLLAPWRWLVRLRRELAAELRPVPTPRGYVDTTLLNVEKWERLPPGATAHAARLAVRELAGDWAGLARALLRRTGADGEGPPPAPAAEQAAAQAAAPPLGASVPTAAATPLGARVPTADELRAFARVAASRARGAAGAAGAAASAAAGVSTEADLRARAAEMAADALRVGRECVDEFLDGFEEGKAEEVRRRAREAEEAAEAAEAAAAATAAPPPPQQQQQQQQLPGDHGRPRA